MIDPIQLPSAAGVDFGNGDVRHFAEGDAVGVPALSNPTRQLAERDTIIATKVNAVIEEVNNKEQIVPIAIPRLVVPASSEEIIANFRIPPGYEARVLNATISSSPLSADIELNVMWANGYGNVTGEAAVSTSSELTGGTKFFPTGEFIIAIKNKGDSTLDLVAQVLLTVRPITAITSAILPAPSVAPPGPPGTKGDTGKPGGPGAGGPPGSPGLVFRQRWTRTPFPVTYSINDVVTLDYAGTSGVSSFVCLSPHIADDVNKPNPTLVPTATWDFLAEAGAIGSTGTGGPPGQPITPTFFQNSLTTDGTTSSNYVMAPDDGDDNYSRTNIRVAGTVFPEIFRWNEYGVQQGTGVPNGLAFLKLNERRNFAGTIAYTLPGLGDGAAGQWDTTTVVCMATIHGTINSADVITTNGTVSTGTFASLCTVVPVPPNVFQVGVISSSPQKIEIDFTGITPLFPA